MRDKAELDPFDADDGFENATYTNHSITFWKAAIAPSVSVVENTAG